MANINVLGPNVEKMKVDAPNVDFEWKELEIGSRSCRRLETLVLRTCEGHILSTVTGLFCHRMPLLVSLELDITGDSVNLSDVMLKLSKHCGTLHEFNLSAASQDRGAFEVLARNANMLQEATISFRDRECWEDWQFSTRAVDGVSSFLPCPALHLLSVSCRHSSHDRFELTANAAELIANRCNQVRKLKPSLHVLVLDIEYLARRIGNSLRV